MSKEVVLNEQETSFRGMLQTLIDSKKLPGHVKTVDDAFTIAQMGKELGFGVMQAFHYIIPIQGKLSLSAKAVGGLLRKGGVKYVTKEDGVWVYPDGTVSETVLSGDVKPIDRRTTILFVRDGLEELCTFTWNDAKLQGLTTKDNWSRMPKEMLFARCLAKGANRIGPDLLLGLYTTEELTDSFNVNEKSIQRDEEGMIKEIIDITTNQK